MDLLKISVPREAKDENHVPLFVRVIHRLNRVSRDLGEDGGLIVTPEQTTDFGNYYEEVYSDFTVTLWNDKDLAEISSVTERGKKVMQALLLDTGRVNHLGGN